MKVKIKQVEIAVVEIIAALTMIIIIAWLIYKR
jgi:hypothetical protein